MDFNFFWTAESTKRNKLTEKYEPVQPFLFLELLHDIKCKIVFDVGANIGFYSMISTLLPDVTDIHSFEAIEETFLELKKNVSLNNLKKRIHCYNLGVSDTEQNISFLISDSPLSGINTAKSSTIHNHNLFSKERKINAIPLDKMFNLKNTCLGFKIDVEGHEESVIRGCTDILKNNQCLIQIESYTKNKESIMQQLGNLGYSNIFECDNDLYFTNIPTLVDSNYMILIIQKCLKKIIDHNLKKWPPNKPSVQFQATYSENKIIIKCQFVCPNFKGKLEYAFYLLIDGNKDQVFWYQENNEFIIPKPESISLERISISCFVREKENPDKKIMTTIKIKSIN